ncbi:hypothetical protein [Frankia gtarii]|uniref:hypothetical protein n=2 Tax=Frankia gtarii TaxID=2950102 RepID=UPI0021C16A86|nr:hypothetical protein [Frankia gtarii]
MRNFPSPSRRSVGTVGALGVGIGTALGAAPAQAAQPAPPPVGFDLRAAGTHSYRAGGPVAGATASGATASGASTQAIEWTCTIYPSDPTYAGGTIYGYGEQKCSGPIAAQGITVYVKHWNDSSNVWERVGLVGTARGGVGVISAEASRLCIGSSSPQQWRTEVAGFGSGDSGSSSATDYSNPVSIYCR